LIRAVKKYQIKTPNELKKIRQIITTIDNDLSLENQVMSYIENEYVNKDDYEFIFVCRLDIILKDESIINVSEILAV
jgi:hypothetical protein